MSNISMTTSKRNVIVMIMLTSAFVSMLNQITLSTVLPAIIKELNITEATAQWLITGFMLVNGIMIPLTAFLMGKYSTRHLHTSSMAIFSIGSIVAVFSPTLIILMISRTIQAIGADILLPLMQLTVFTLFLAEQRGFVMGSAGVVVQSASAIGSTLTELPVDLSSWRMPFYLVLAIAAVASILGFSFVGNNTKTKNIVLDKISVAYSTFGFGLILFIFSGVSTFGTTSLPVTVTFVLGIVIIIIFITRQFKLRHSLSDMRVFKDKAFILSAVFPMLVYIMMVSPALLIPIYIQTGLGQSALLSGVVVLPGAVISGSTMVYIGKIFDKYDIKVFVIPGFILLISMTFLYSFLTTGTLYRFIILVYIIRMIALGLLVMPLNTVGLNAPESNDVSHGTAIMDPLRIIAGAMGTAVSVTILPIAAKQYTASHSAMSKMRLTQEATVYGIDVAFIFTTALIIIGLILALSIKEEKNH